LLNAKFWDNVINLKSQRCVIFGKYQFRKLCIRINHMETIEYWALNTIYCDVRLSQGKMLICIWGLILLQWFGLLVLDQWVSYQIKNTQQIICSSVWKFI